MLQDVLQVISGLWFVADATNVSDKFLLWLCILILNKTLNHSITQSLNHSIKSKMHWKEELKYT